MKFSADKANTEGIKKVTEEGGTIVVPQKVIKASQYYLIFQHIKMK